MNEVTVDTISLRGAGVVTVAQPAKGHRFTLDSVLLADFCRLKPRDRVLEPGTGTGIISVLLARKHPNAVVTAVELQPDVADLCRWNVHVNDLQERVALLEQDIKALRRHLSSGSFDVIVGNPPYTKGRSGRRSPHSSRRTARHGESSDIATWLALQAFLKNKGRFYIVFPAGRSVELLSSLQGQKLEPKRVRFVHSYEDKPASVVLVEAVKSAGTGLEVLAPLVVHRPGGEYSKEMRDIYGLAE